MRYARWHDSLATGDAEVDGQHRALYELVNDLNASDLLGVGHQAESEALQRIVQYAASHFGTEKALMERFEYPGIAEHVALHDEFAEAAQGLLAEHIAGRGPNIHELAAFMEEWLETHIGTVDQPMVQHVRAARLRDEGAPRP
jgi:methyl-accepting chemotaxis protein